MELTRVLYVEDDPADQELTRRHLGRHAPQVKMRVAETVAEALARIAEGDLDLVLADYRLSDGTGLDLLEAMKAKEFHLPVVLVTGSRDVQAAVRLLRAGAADYVVKRPGYLETLVPVLEGALQWFQSAAELRRTPVRVLYAEHDPIDIELTSRALREDHPHFQLEAARGGREALERLKTVPYDLLLLDCRMPDLSGIEVLKALREERVRIPVVMVTGQADEDTAVQAFKLGVADYVVKGEGYLTRLPSTLENALARHRLSERRRAAEALARVGRLLSQSLATDEVQQQIVDHVRTLLGTQNAVLFRMNSGSEDLVAVAFAGELGATFRRGMILPRGTGVAGLAVRDRRAVAAVDLLTDARIQFTPKSQRHFEEAPFGSVLSAPLIVTGTVVGALTLGDRRGRVFTVEEMDLVQSFADQAAVALRNAQLFQEAQDARDFLRSIAENSADAILTTDVQGCITYFSPGAEEILGYHSAEALGRAVAEYYRGGWEEMRTLMQRVAVEGRIKNFDTALLTKDHRWVDVSSSISLLRDSGGKVVGTVAVFRDITEQRRQAEALRQSEERLRQAQKIEAVGRLAGGIAHDFNNLVTVMLGRTKLLLQCLRAEDPIYRHMELVRETAERAARLTEQLLAFSRKRAPQPKVLDVNQVVTGIVEIVRRLIGEDIEMVTLLSPDLWGVRADAGQMEQVLMNLAINARDAMPQGGRLVIETANAELDAAFCRDVSWVTPGPHVRLTVRDSGMGMDAETRARLFEPFFTTKGGSRGTGLGLSIVHTIVKEHGGQIAVESEPGHGTAFSIYLPRAERAEELEEGDQTRTQLLRGWETILLVEDEEGVRDLTRELLGGYGYTVLEARHPGDALLIAEHHPGPINLLVTDVMMPQMKGPELAARLVPQRPGIKVLYISGYTEKTLDPSDLRAPGVSFLQKPFELDALLGRVRSLLDSA